MSILSLLCGVAFFLFGMSLMGSGLKSVAGPKMEKYLWKLSSTPVKGFLLGTLVAAVIQSSSATSVMTVSFINAGMMKLSQAVCIVLGSNLGTTMTGWILTLSGAGKGEDSLVAALFGTASLVAYFALIGIVLFLFCRKKILKNVGQISLGLATLLLGMTLISDAVEPLKESAVFSSVITTLNHPLLGIAAGILIAAVLQSSSASVGILQALCVTGALPLSLCFPVILGINVGASTPVLLSMMGSTRDGKRTALSYLLSNVLTIPVAYLLYFAVRLIFGNAFLAVPATVFSIALMNTAVKAGSAPFLLAGHKLIEKLCFFFVPVKSEESEDTDEIDSLNDRLLNYTPAALEKAGMAAQKMLQISKKNVLRAIRLLTEFDRPHYQKVQEKESLVDKYEDKLNNFIVKMSKHELSVRQQAQVSELLNAIGDFERLSDHAVNLSEVAMEIYEKKIVFSPEARHEIALLTGAVTEIILLAEESFCRNDRETVKRIEPLEEVVDMLCKRMKANHIARLQRDECTILSGFVFNDLLTNLERVADHCSNIAFCVQHGSNINAEEHRYTESIVNSSDFKLFFEEYCKKYVVPLDSAQ